MNGKKTEDQKLFDFSSYEEQVNLSLLRNHIHFINGDIDEFNTLNAIKWITYENTLSENNDLLLFINSNGGNLHDAFALIEVMRKSNKDIKTIGLGSICSAAFLIFASGTKGKRYIGKYTSIMCHQFTDAYSGKYHDIKATVKENDLSNQKMISLLKECTGLDSRTIKNKLLPPTDVWFTSEEIIELKVADHIF